MHMASITRVMEVYLRSECLRVLPIQRLTICRRSTTSPTAPGPVATQTYWSTANDHHQSPFTSPPMPSYLYRPPPFSAPAPSDPQAYAYNPPSSTYNNGHLPPMRVPAEEQASGGWVYPASYNASFHQHQGSFHSHQAHQNMYHSGPLTASYASAMQMPTPGYVTPSLFPSWSNERGSGRESPKVKNEHEELSQASPLGSDHASIYGQDERHVDITYTSESEAKVTAELKRCCYNCSATSPPSWRKSILNMGKILCNSKRNCHHPHR
ncbi:hypothetical protein BCR39DRAFT_380362 [Naematelia encephala]|uniref:GATA-type domain-containing protein n=1 Tax=Naematelia encephala TaxID=71784 RepID=A0A1Y2BDQ5_9TREE|nr:hypothetical protein BCR39DRAFT_380362 [Naematelia encephala]